MGLGKQCGREGMRTSSQLPQNVSTNTKETVKSAGVLTVVQKMFWVFLETRRHLSVPKAIKREN